MEENKQNLPSIKELHEESINIQNAFKNEVLNGLLNQQPLKEWIKEHPYIKGYKYLPIDKIEFLLRRIFKRYRIEILREGTAFNGVYVCVRVHYENPITGVMDFHDGIGAAQLQTKKDTSPSDLLNINNGALSMAFPIAKTVAIKDACDHFGSLFGANLNRKDVQEFSVDEKIINRSDLRKQKLVDNCKTLEELTVLENANPTWDKKLFETKKLILKISE